MPDNSSSIPDTPVVSRSGARHIDSGKLEHGRIRALCGFSLHPDEGPYQGLRDCAFCQKEAADARQKAEAAEALELLRAGVRTPGDEASLQPEDSN
jgi:hypothetical protein